MKEEGKPNILLYGFSWKGYSIWRRSLILKETELAWKSEEEKRTRRKGKLRDDAKDTQSERKRIKIEREKIGFRDIVVSRRKVQTKVHTNDEYFYKKLKQTTKEKAETDNMKNRKKIEKTIINSKMERNYIYLPKVEMNISHFNYPAT